MYSNGQVAAHKVAIVTGAALRIGAGISRRLHDQGYCVLIHYRSSEKAALQLVQELNSIRANSAICIHAELQQGRVNGLIKAAIEQWQRLDLLVNNASEFYPTPVGKITDDDVHKLFGTNLRAPLLLAQAALPELTKSQGSVINILDIYSVITHKGHSVYSASKAALSMLTKSLATEFAPDVRVNGVSPGAILWPGGSEKLSEEKKRLVLSKVPLKRLGSENDIADAVLYLASAEYVTGHILNVDGGRSL